MENNNDIIENSLDENAPKLDEGKSIDVFNALNLYNEQLGSIYEKDGYNPFEEGFVLTEEFTNDVLENKKKQEIFTEDFLEYGNKEVSKHFQNALTNSTEIIDKLNEELASCTDEKVKSQIKKSIILLKNRNELLKVNISKLKQKDANALKMYIEMFGMDNELSELLKDTFNEKVNAQIVAQQMLTLCHSRAVNIKQKTTKIIERESLQANEQQQQQEVATQQVEQTKVQEQKQPEQQIKEPQKEQEQVKENEAESSYTPHTCITHSSNAEYERDL